MKGPALVLAALVALAIAAAALAPATIVDSRIAVATSGMLRLDDASGTVWHGRGTLVDAQGNVAVPVAWSLAPWPLLRRKVDVTLLPDASRPGQPSGRLARADGAWHIERLAATVPSALLPAIAQTNVPLALAGDVRIDIASLDAGRTSYAASGSLRWQSAAIGLPALAPLALGDVDVALASRERGVVGLLQNRGGDVRASGEVFADPERTSLDVLLVPVSGAPPALARLLAAIGTPESGGARIRWQGAPLLR